MYYVFKLSIGYRYLINSLTKNNIQKENCLNSFLLSRIFQRYYLGHNFSGISMLVFFLQDKHSRLSPYEFFSAKEDHPLIHLVI